MDGIPLGNFVGVVMFGLGIIIAFGHGVDVQHSIWSHGRDRYEYDGVSFEEFLKSILRIAIFLLLNLLISRSIYNLRTEICYAKKGSKRKRHSQTHLHKNTA